ncbi:MAG: carboxynorspermidine decarboxylase [Methylococcaceae bacterium]|jgi:carboxynorspermidine decarboxylase|nr:carboxynorspermidine decarboxylase [Methylococcaceae bacterium]MDD1644157.1 carboxynorspermidine decarboxylase [Methylococcaceae bacterium]
MDFQLIKDSISSSPVFFLDADEIIKTLKLLNTLRHRCGCKVLYSIKALPFSSVLEITKPFVDGFSVSSLFEARLADEILAGQGCIHLTTPGIRPDEWDDMARLLTHISFNSLTQYQRFASAAQVQTSFGLRVNPKLSFVKDDRFDPCRLHSKLGVDIDELWQSSCLDQVKGLHIHNVFSATDFTPLIKTIEKLRSYFGKNLAQLDWLNLGGGYLFNQINDYRPFTDLVNQLKKDFDLDVYIEPGKSVVGSSGHLVTTVIDSFVSDGKTVAILDTSVNHNPEVFEYQRQPELHEHDPKGRYSAILAGCTCLAGDVFGEYRFSKPLVVGDKVFFKNVGAYSLIKANRFNGYNLPDIYMVQDLQVKKLKQYPYQDYRQQWLAD